MRVVFFFENEWAFGSIHNELAKRLYSCDINCFVLPWNINYSRQEMQELDRHIDFWVTSSAGTNTGLLTYGIPKSRIGVVDHSESDLHKRYQQLDSSEQFLFEAVVSESLRLYGQAKFSLTSLLLPVRISVGNYRSIPPKYLNKIGFASSVIDLHEQNKRFSLVKESCRIANIELVVATSYHHSWITNTSFYGAVDAVVQSSVREGFGLPVLEAGAAGRLVFSTNVGAFAELVTEQGADMLPMDPDDLVRTLVERINFYRDNPVAFEERANEIEAHASSYDWGHVLHIWEETLRKHAVTKK